MRPDFGRARTHGRGRRSLQGLVAVRPQRPQQRPRPVEERGEVAQVRFLPAEDFGDVGGCAAGAEGQEPVKLLRGPKTHNESFAAVLHRTEQRPNRSNVHVDAALPRVRKAVGRSPWAGAHGAVGAVCTTTHRSGRCWGRLEVDLGSIWEGAGVDMGSAWDPFGAHGPIWGPCGLHLGSIWGPFGVHVVGRGWIWVPSGAHLGSIWEPFGVHLL